MNAIIFGTNDSLIIMILVIIENFYDKTNP